MHGHASLHLLLLAFLGLRLTYILPSIPPKSYLSHQNEKVLPRSIEKPQYKHNWIKGNEYVPFSPTFSIETVRNTDPIRAKRGQNRGLSLPHAYLLLVSKQDYITKYQRGDKPLATLLLRQRTSSQSTWPTCVLKMAKSKCKIFSKAYVLPSMNPSTQMQDIKYPNIKAHSKTRPSLTSDE